ncbi:helix-turn-helix domain-containing protein [Actinomadura decatromicini]|uniref:Helix-turn-helix transcriptional regulator n=1 Tax=Actinomadura decatromicini TaxID=2604572 RepID=A0A5D3F6I4_9ACTN|nr:helix-turn-helix transcriptional regulator [Actinomadura decatromicini]TYK43280.1 helix-turn-helix transcriptional regulator [Actinomadura decatromicini]
MPSSPSPSSSVQAARQALADRLREIRQDAGLSGRALSEAAQWHPAKTSRIERGGQPATAADIQKWCEVCGVIDLAPDLVASLRAVEGAYVEWRRLERTGLSRLQQTYVPLYERTTHFRVYQSHVVPGLLQTVEYASALLSAITMFRRIPNDAEAAASGRVERQRVLYSERRFAFLVEEAVLMYGVGDSDVMAAQLRHLLTMMRLPSVSFGVIPMNARPRRIWTLEGFTIFDDVEVQIELLTAKVTVSAPGELSVYARAFGELATLAVTGDQARALIEQALDALS